MTDKPRRASAARLRSILLVGPPGSGKGTQGRILGRIPGFLYVSMGDVLRSLNPDREPGRTVQQHLRAGELVPAALVVSAWDQHLEKKIEAGFQPPKDLLVLDGFPRNVEQAEWLESRVETKQVLRLVCDNQDLLLERIRQRQEGRKDDVEEEIIRHRFAVYRENTVPMLRWYPEEIVVPIDATGSPLEVLCQIVNVLARADCHT